MANHTNRLPRFSRTDIVQAYSLLTHADPYGESAYIGGVAYRLNKMRANVPDVCDVSQLSPNGLTIYTHVRDTLIAAMNGEERPDEG